MYKVVKTQTHTRIYEMKFREESKNAMFLEQWLNTDLSTNDQMTCQEIENCCEKQCLSYIEQIQIETTLMESKVGVFQVNVPDKNW